MRIYIFRHGEALPKDDSSVASDADRPLIDDGIRRTKQAAEGLKNMQFSFDAVFTSPWLRARQTAEIVCDVLGIKDRLEEMDALAGDRSVSDVLQALSRHSRHGDVMIVGHNPLLAEVGAYLLSLATDMQIDLKKSGICVVEVERIPPKKPGTLLWMMTPKQLRAAR